MIFIKNIYIFIIAGKAQTGKDTTAKLIRKYADNYNLKTAIIQYSMYIKLYAKALLDWNFDDATKPRTLLQDIGNDVRARINPHFFTNRIIDDINVLSNYAEVIVISDARLPEEIAKINDTFSNVTNIHIVKDEKQNGLDLKQANHITETALDNYDNFDFVIENNGTIKDLENQVSNIFLKVIN